MLYILHVRGRTTTFLGGGREEIVPLQIQTQQIKKHIGRDNKLMGVVRKLTRKGLGRRK